MGQRSRHSIMLAGLLQSWLLAACAELPQQAVSVSAPVAEAAAPPAPAPEPVAEQPPVPQRAAAESVVAQAPAAEAATEAALAALPEPDRGAAAAQETAPLPAPRHQASVDQLCEQIGNKLGSVSVEDCLAQRFEFGGGFSVNQRPLVIKEQAPLLQHDDALRVLIMGGIHGDEYSSISIMFKWLGLFSPEGPEGDFHWRFAPLVNPDGLLDGSQARRQNANGVDLNRNFPSRDWNATAATYWQESTGSNPRRFPGRAAASEPEVQWVVRQIEQFRPDVIVSVHAPYHLLDFDGPAKAPDRIGELYLHQLGIYPGSLGNFAGLNRSIPVVTLELPSAGIMPSSEEIDLMWRDLVAWLDREGRRGVPATASTR